MRNLRTKSNRAWLASLAAVLAAGATTTGLQAQNSDPLLDLFIKKGFVTEDEAARVKAEADAQRTNEVPSAVDTKWKISKGLKSVELYGDLRFRYEDRSASDPRGNSIGLQRLRYSLRLGLRGEALDDFYYGFRLDPSANPRSAWLTFGTVSSSGNPQGPFGKSSSGMNLGQVYLGWKPEDWVDITVGKMPNPLYTTTMVWDSDLNPEGFAERFKYTVGEADFFATFGQFLYQDTNPTQAKTGFFPTLTYNHSVLPFLLAFQGGVNYHIDKKLTFKVAPTVYVYTDHGVNPNNASDSPGFRSDFVGQGATTGFSGEPVTWSGWDKGFYEGFIANQTGINNLLVLEIPFELNYKMDSLNVKLFGEYAQNLEGEERAKTAASGVAAAQANAIQINPNLVVAPISSPQIHEDKAYQVGVAFSNKDSKGDVIGGSYLKHGWEVRSYWQHIEQYALDPNLLDSDFFEGRGNLEGIYAALAFDFSPNVFGTVRYGYASRINKNLGTGGSNQDIPQMNPIEKFSLVQFDLSLKF